MIKKLLVEIVIFYLQASQYHHSGLILRKKTHIQPLFRRHYVQCVHFYIQCKFQYFILIRLSLLMKKIVFKCK